jgi:hypothetical protein
MGAPCYILEGTWWSNQETPQVLPYFQALQASQSRITLSHRTIRSADDISYWIGKIPAGKQAIVYIACHGQDLELCPADGRSPVRRPDLLEALKYAKKGAIGFLHFSCCEMVDPDNRRKSLDELAQASGARWVSGYGVGVDWLRSALFDLALVAELFVPYYYDSKKKNPKLAMRTRSFLSDYEQLARSLSFSGLYRNRSKGGNLFPQRMRG